jgi:transcriptional regulator with XRE-family HTH domain
MGNVLIPIGRKRQNQKEVSLDPPYRTDLINGAMGTRRLTNKVVAEKAGVGVMTVSKIRNGNPRVGYLTLKKVVEAIGLTIAEVSEPRTA